MTRQKPTDTIGPRAEIGLADLAAVVGGTATAPRISEIVVTKRLDKASTMLF